MNQKVVDRLVIGCVPSLCLADVKILAEEQPDLTRMVPVVYHFDGAEEDRPFGIHGVVAVERDAKLSMREADVRDEGIGEIVHLSLPAVVVKPGETAVYPDPHAVGMADRVVVPADMREIEITQAIAAVEVHQQAAVADRKIPWHFPILAPFYSGSSNRAPAQAEEP
jgi:hypothetical protein